MPEHSRIPWRRHRLLSIVAVWSSVLIASAAHAFPAEASPFASATSKSTASKSTAPIVITIKDHAVSTSPTTTTAGLIMFRLVNGDTILHEIDIVQTTLGPTGLPLKTNGQFNEHAPGIKVVKEAVKIKAGATRQFTATLRRGTYVLVDNLPGHYKNGEATTLTVN